MLISTRRAEAEAKAAAERAAAEAAEEAKKKEIELEREKARAELDQVERTVDLDVRCPSFGPDIHIVPLSRAHSMPIAAAWTASSCRCMRGARNSVCACRGALGPAETMPAGLCVTEYRLALATVSQEQRKVMKEFEKGDS